MTDANNYRGDHRSLWLATTPGTTYPPAESDVAVDVAIIGGGIAGLTTAHLLKQAGLRVAVVEANRIVESVTAYTTAKLTSQHNLIYDYLISTFGEETAFQYAAANQAGVELVARLVENYKIDCDFVRAAAYTYAAADKDVEKIEKEVKAANRIGLPAEYVTAVPLPFPVTAAVRFRNQAHFHPRKYLLALAQMLPGEGSYLFERTQALRIDEGEPCRVVTTRGTITAQDVVVATHFPFMDNAFYFARMSPYRSYVLAMSIEGTPPDGMFISTESDGSIRPQRVDGKEVLLIGGQGHKTGQGGDTVACYQRLEAWAREHLPMVRDVLYSWSTQDLETFDRIPYIGKLSPATAHVYVATGFKGWGMSSGSAAGILLTGLIRGQDTPWARPFDPNRINLAGIPEMAKENFNVAKELAAGYVLPKRDEAPPLGEGCIVDGPQGRVAMYHAEDGTVVRLSPVCTHMGCIVNWNPAEKSWDCPCHGSRFAADGHVIEGPAQRSLEPKVD